jgi:putative tryptophan/tyrosine transport system substrate-binding protein
VTQMRRREFIKVVGSAAVGWSLAAQAQQPARPLTVGLVLSAVPSSQLTGPEPTFPPARAFVHRIRNVGLIGGRAITIVIRSAEGQPERAPAIIAELIGLGADVIVVIAADWLLDAARDATRTIPTIALFVFDPAAAGRVASLARPGGNLTGVTTTT